MNQQSRFDTRLDLVRFIAFFLVFFTHFINEGGNAIRNRSDVWWNQDFIQRFADFGGQGVPIFFALTGFLLGRLLIREFTTTKSISIRSFYIRRVYRIWPLYFLYLIICFLANPFSSGTPAINKSELPFYLTFTYNWGQIFANLPGSMATITWSVSVEEQIYLFLPVLVSLISFRKFEIASFLLVSLGTISLVMSDFGYIPGHARLTTSYFVPVGIGLFVAIKEDLVRNSKRDFRFIKWLVLFLAISYVAFFPEISATTFGETATMFLTSFFFVALLFTADRFVNVENTCVKLLARIGRVSYGCYLYHWAVWTVMTGKEFLYSDNKGFSILGVLVGLLATIAISEFSYRYFESWFLKKRKKYQIVESP